MRESKVLNEFEYESFKLFSNLFQPLTKNQYLIKVNLFKEFLNGKELVEVDKYDCEKFIEYISSIYTKSTCEKIFSYLHSYYNFLIKENIIYDNPFKKVRKPKVSKLAKRSSILTIDEIDLIIENISKEKIRDQALIVFLITTGCMVNELIRVKWRDISFFKNDYYITLSKNGKSRMIKMHSLCTYLLNEYRGSKAIEDNDELIFTSAKTNSITDRNVRFIVRKILDKSGLTNNSSKDFRHSFAAISLRLGAN
ncbi:MAG: tyrosine-type recombinase/integrase, partial [Peptostreptococcaceae bacterium]